LAHSLAQIFLISLLVIGNDLALAGSNDMTLSADLRNEVEMARKKGGPLVVIYSRRDCKYCETVKRDYLQPLANNPHYRDRIEIRQVNQDGDGALTDFQGNPTNHARLATSEKVKLVPVVAFYGPNGKQLADRIVGTRLPDFYPSYLEEALDRSIGELKKP
jgi:thioredoxin-related protein